MKIIGIALAAVLILFCGLCAGFAMYIVHGRRQTIEEAWNWQQEHVKNASKLTRDMFKDYIVKGSRGEDIHVSFLPARNPGNKYVILAHGYTDNRFGMIKYAVHYYELGYNCIMFDERGHGENAKEPCSYSVREVDFLLDVLKDSFDRYGKDIVIGLHGESLGSATVLMSLKYDIVKEHVAFAVDDCGFAKIIPVIERYMKVLHVPGWMIYPTDIAARIMYGISFKAAAPIAAVKENKIPLLCVHGAQDDFILPEHSRLVFEASKGPKEIRLVEGAGHAQSAIIDPEGYFEMLKSFLESVFSQEK